MTHACPVAACTIKAPDDVFMCARHWRMVPKPLQAAIYEDFRRVGARGENHREAIRIVNETEAGRAALELPAGTKALTLWEPWASLIIIGAKPYEFRRWNFADKPHLARLIGQRIVIHAGARKPRPDELRDILYRIEEGESALAGQIAAPFVNSILAGAPLPLSRALGTAIIGEPKRSADLFEHIVADSDRLDHQMYAWPMTDIRPFAAPIPAAGAQGFWNWS